MWLSTVQLPNRVNSKFNQKRRVVKIAGHSLDCQWRVWLNETHFVQTTFLPNGMQLWQDTNNACSQFPDNQGPPLEVYTTLLVSITHTLR